jgi:SP family general alpha glucoside:H+ symporter-like MFS transporter
VQISQLHCAVVEAFNIKSSTCHPGIDNIKANMEDEKVVPTVQELAGFDLNDRTIIELIHQAQESDAADRLLTIRQALKKYKKAVFWAMILSTSLIMEGYDLVIVRCTSPFIQFRRKTEHMS